MTPTSANDPPAAASPTLLPTDAFFVRWLPLVPGAEVEAQVEIALENFSPFPRTQLYSGYIVAPARTSALVFAAWQKRFSPAETGPWPEAAAVLPEFLALLGEPPTRPVIRVWQQDQVCIGAAWDGQEPLPRSLLAGSAGADTRAEVQKTLCQDLRTRTGLVSAEVMVYSGPCQVVPDRRRNLFQFSLTRANSRDILTTSLPVAAIDTADVRDRNFLAEQRRLRRRDLLLWRGLLTCLMALAAFLALEAGLVGGRQWLARTRTLIQLRAEPVRQIETAQLLSTRIEELTQKQLRPFEMMAIINAVRPASVQFTRAVSLGVSQMEIEAQTANAADVSRFETSLRASADLAGIVTRDLRARNGVTTFILTITYKPEALRPEVRP
jgi:hypothetical protein